jgi:nucleoside-diphosphate-sugar epimerase
VSPSTVVVTEASGLLGGQLAADPAIDRVLALDPVSPRPELSRRLGRAEFSAVDLRNPLIAKVISDAQVDTVVHASMSAHPRSAGWRTAIKELNVISTMQLLADCQRSTTVRRLVVKSTGAVYGLSLEIRLSAPSEMNRTRSRPLVTPRRPRESRATFAVSSGSARMRTSRYCALPTSSARASRPR